MSYSKSKPLPASILVVDDDLNNLQLLRGVLGKQGYNVRLVRDGRLVLAAAQAKLPNLILLDIMMPFVNGFEVCAQLKADEITCNIPVIFLSALDEAEEKVKAFSVGGVDYITKPFQIQEMIARIENQLQICLLQKQLQEQNKQLQKEIQERLLMEEKLRSAQEEIRGFFEAMADIVLIVDLAGNTIKIAPTNPEKLYPSETNILDQTIELLLGEEGEVFRSQIRRALNMQQVVNYEYSLNIGQELIWFSASIAPTSDHTVAWVARDISDRKKAEDELRLLLESTQAISQSPDLETALTDILYLISRAINWDFAEAWLPNEENTLLEPCGGWYRRHNGLEPFRQYRETITFAPGQGLAGQVWLSGKPEWIEDMSQADESKFDRADIAASVGLKAALAIPVMADDFQHRGFQWPAGYTPGSQQTSTKLVLVFFKRSAGVKDYRVLRVVNAITTLISSFMKRKQAEIALRKSQARLQKLTASVPGAIYEYVQSTDGSERFEYISSAIRELQELEPEVVLENPNCFFTQIHPEDWAGYYEALAISVITLEPFHYEWRNICPSGKLKWLEAKAQPERGNDGDIVWYGVVFDVSGRKRAEEEIASARERLELVLRASQDGFWDWNFLTAEIYFSPRYKEMLGYSDEELPNQLSSWQTIIFEEDYIEALKRLEDYNLGQIPQFLTTQRFRHKNGSTIYILSRAIHLKDKAGNIIRMIGTHTDITNLKQTEEALQKAVLAADAANRSKSEFLASMSHELRTPLNAILGFSQIMSDDQALSMEHQKNLNIINRAGEHLLALIDDILEVSKIEAGRTKFTESSFDIRQLLNSLEQMLQLKAGSKGLQLIFEYSPNIPQYVSTDEGKLRQVLLNLLGNAIKFTKTGRVSLWVSAMNPQPSETQSLTLHFEIEDTGPGIAAEEIYLLFEAFGQTEVGRKSQQGTGLGLPISQKYVNLMGGEITVTSILNQGSIFAFDIVVQLAEAESVPTRQSNRKVMCLAPHQPEYRILIVDDVAESRLLLHQILIPIGFLVREADNGKDAVKLWRQWQPHVILMDMRMPIMNGYDATRQIRLEEEQRILQYSSSVSHHLSSTQGQLLTLNSSNINHLPPRTIIFALTASGFDEQRKIMIAEGCDDLVRKPFQVNVLLNKISEYLGVEYEWKTVQQQEENLETIPQKIGDIDVLHLLDEMSPEWMQELYEASSECSDDLVLKLIDKIPEDQTILANMLRNLAENFQFGKLMKLAQGELE